VPDLLEAGPNVGYSIRPGSAGGGTFTLGAAQASKPSGFAAFAVTPAATVVLMQEGTSLVLRRPALAGSPSVGVRLAAQLQYGAVAARDRASGETELLVPLAGAQRRVAHLVLSADGTSASAPVEIHLHGEALADVALLDLDGDDDGDVVVGGAPVLTVIENRDGVFEER
jgi:hypothetical protein